MAIAGIDPKCYILALFVRDDGVRFLLGDDPYEFKDKQLHFQPNTVANDVVEVQGNDGYLLAGQVRRPGTQSFDGYVCNGTNSKAEVEVKRREFLQFFRRSHFYKVIYVFPNGTAIQRKQGFLVDDPTVQELYQQYPEYHVALNFEDVNYYTYEEDDQGQEIYAKETIVPLAGGGATGGLIWDEYGVVWEEPWSDLISVSGSEIQIENEAGAMAPIQDLELQGDTYQNGTPTPDAPIPVQTVTGEQTVTVTGKNLWGWFSADMTRTVYDISFNNLANGDVFVAAGTSSGQANSLSSSMVAGTDRLLTLEAGTYTISGAVGIMRVQLVDSSGTALATDTGNGATVTLTSQTKAFMRVNFDGGQTVANTTVHPQLEKSPTVTDYEPCQKQFYEINLGKNLFDKNNVNQYMGYYDGDADSPILVSGATTRNRVIYIKCKPSTTYSVSLTNRDGINSPQVGTTDSLPDTGLAVAKLGKFASGSLKLENLTTSTTAQYIVIRFQTNPSTVRFDDISQTLLSGLQIEEGSTATSYASFFTPIELCKIGDYQDYIYKSGDDWYVHKEVRHLSLAIAEMNNSSNYPGWTGLSQVKEDLGSHNDTLALFTSSQTNISGYIEKNPNIPSGPISINTTGTGVLYFRRPWYGQDMTQEYWQQNYPNLVVELYYGINNQSTDTKITDATLVGQLEALGAMKLFIGENNLLVSATGTNLPATLEFSYPTKFAAIGAEWEEGGTKGATIVDVNAIDNTYPVWELMGPAVNPTLSVLTTNTTLTYNGTITASQKLVIDMFNKTATLNGTSVIGNVSGDFVYMAPGTNRIAYTAGNTDAPDSTIYWQEVVG